jgi:hypothetical protein
MCFTALQRQHTLPQGVVASYTQKSTQQPCSKCAPIW